MMVMLLGIFYHPTDALYTPIEVPAVETTHDVVKLFLVELPHYAEEVFRSILPVIGVFLVFQLLTRK